MVTKSGFSSGNKKRIKGDLWKKVEWTETTDERPSRKELFCRVGTSLGSSSKALAKIEPSLNSSQARDHPSRISLILSFSFLGSDRLKALKFRSSEYDLNFTLTRFNSLILKWRPHSQNKNKKMDLTNTSSPN